MTSNRHGNIASWNILPKRFYRIADIDNGRGATRIRETYLWDPTQPEATRPLAMIRLDSNLGTEVPTWESRQISTRSLSSSSSQAPMGPPNIDVEMLGVYYYVHDHNKNVVGLQEENAYLVAQYEYDPYGNIVNLNEGCERWNPFRFSSEYHNDVTGLVDYLYRSYNPIDGRWAQRDPIAEQGGVNLYGFIYNNPTNYTDYCGLEKAATCESEDDIGRYGILKMKPQMYTALDAKWPAGEVELPEINNGFIEYSSTFIKNTFIKRLK